MIDDLGPCLNTWTPRTCRSTAISPAAKIRSPIDHACWLSRVMPHVCRCARCGHPLRHAVTSTKLDA